MRQPRKYRDIKARKTKEKIEQEIEQGELEKDPYSEEGREVLTEDDDELNEFDEGIMQGIDEGENLAKCALCHKVLVRDFFEREFEGEVYRFCTEDHARIYARKRKAR